MATSDESLTDVEWEQSAKSGPRPEVTTSGGVHASAGTERPPSTGNPIHDAEDGKPYTRCGANLKKGGTCQNRAGQRTDHEGSGKCWLHGGRGGRRIKHGKYSRYGVIKAEDAKAYRAHLEADPDPYDLLPDLIQLRVLVVDYCNRYNEMQDALEAWHASFDNGFQIEYQKWQNDYRDWLATYKERYPEHDNDDEMAELPPPPAPLNFVNKPRRIVDILSVGKFISDIGAMVKRIHEMQNEGKISLVDIDRALEQYGMMLVQTLGKHIEDSDVRQKILADIEQQWNTVIISPRARSG
jgi:hypothetical protein